MTRPFNRPVWEMVVLMSGYRTSQPCIYWVLDSDFLTFVSVPDYDSHLRFWFPVHSAFGSPVNWAISLQSFFFFFFFNRPPTSPVRLPTLWVRTQIWRRIRSNSWPPSCKQSLRRMPPAALSASRSDTPWSLSCKLPLKEGSPLLELSYCPYVPHKPLYYSVAVNYEPDVFFIIWFHCYIWTYIWHFKILPKDQILMFHKTYNGSMTASVSATLGMHVLHS